MSEVCLRNNVHFLLGGRGRDFSIFSCRHVSRCILLEHADLLDIYL